MLLTSKHKQLKILYIFSTCSKCFDITVVSIMGYNTIKTNLKCAPPKYYRLGKDLKKCVCVYLLAFYLTAFSIISVSNQTDNKLSTKTTSGSAIYNWLKTYLVPRKITRD